MEKISVIVPVYNAENFLEKCLNSIVNQTYPKIEIVLVNDCSTDNSDSICKKYQTEHNNVVYIELEENGGVANARNVGLRNAGGALIGFVDNDDWAEKEMYQSLYETLVNHNVPMVTANFKQVRYETQREREYIPLHKSDLYIGNTLDALLYTVSNRDVILWNKLYRRELFREIEFPVRRTYEDISVIHLLVEKAGQIAVSTKCVYNYHLQPESITRSKKVTTKIFEQLYVIIERYEYLASKKYSVELEQLCRREIFFTLTQVVDKLRHINIADHKDISEEFVKAKEVVYGRYSYEGCGFLDTEKKVFEALRKNIQHYNIYRDMIHS